MQNKGITILSLVVTGVIMLILSGVTINLVLNDNGVIVKSQEAAFRTELLNIKEQVNIEQVVLGIDGNSIQDKWQKVEYSDLDEFTTDLIFEMVYWGQVDTELNLIEKKYVEKNWKTIVHEEDTENWYYVSSKIGGKEQKYIYDVKFDKVYKVPYSKVGRLKVHSIDELDYLQEYGTRERLPNEGTLIKEEAEYVTANEISHYEPDLKGFLREKTFLIYYNEEDLEDYKEISAIDYFNNGKKRTVQDGGKTYVFYDYSEENKIWANIKTINSKTNLETWWVWVPRYAYKIQDTLIDTYFVQIGEEIKDGYILHPDFEDGKKGIWASKYEPIQTANSKVDNYSYYIPDMTGFLPNDTYIELFDEENNCFTEVCLADIEDLYQFSLENNWFDYENKIWANIRTENLETQLETWWVWVPRYAYSVTSKNIDIKFVDLNGKPLSGEELPAGYIVHPAFGDNLKGIWVSKYEPIQTTHEAGRNNNVNPPDLVGYNVDRTYIESYDSLNNCFIEQKLSEVLENTAVVENNILKSGKVDLNKVNGIWYDYSQRIWANIKAVNPDTQLETWWVWVPKYAYNVVSKQVEIVFIDKDGKMSDGSDIPANYIPHPAFTGDNTGIWASKYEPINTLQE